MKNTLLLALLAFGILLPSGAFAEPGTASVEVAGNSYIVSYDATGVEVVELDVDDEPPTLIVFVSSTDVEGILEITLDRVFLDSKADDGTDEDYLVLADGLPVTFTESASDASRTLTISIPSGTLSVDIVGTDFGASPTEEAPEVTLEEAPKETGEIPEEVSEPEPVPEETMCGAGTVLQNGVCVLETAPEPEEPAPTEEEAPMGESICGPGTILKDGACVLDETCGPGTILVDGQCVLDESAVEPAPAKSSRGMAFEFAMPLVAAFIIAFIIMIVLWAIGKAGSKKN